MSSQTKAGSLLSRCTARIVLEDGTIQHGRSFGADGTSIGELVFNTALSGYQEIVTDPSYRGQVVLFTSPHIGNYGICPEDDESARPWLGGVIVREASRIASNFRAGLDLPTYLRQQGIVSIDNVDTRLLTGRLRKMGALKVLMTTDPEPSDEDLLQQVKAAEGLDGRDLVREVCRKHATQWDQGYEPKEFSPRLAPKRVENSEAVPIVVIDCGIKRNILRSLVEVGFKVTVVPATMSADEMLALSPQGVFISNGPGDPAAVPYLLATIRTLCLDRGLPTFGICLGHQILSQVLGGKTYKMPFGHHGGNHPVKELATGEVQITSQNHSYAVDADSLPDGVRVTHVNLNDGSVEGIEHKELGIWSVQYHPEASPGPHDAIGLFGRFRDQFG